MSKKDNALNSNVEVLIAHPDIPNSDFLTIDEIPKKPEYKHLNLK